MVIRFTKHALQKFAVLKGYGVLVTKKRVVETVRTPKRIDYSRLPLLIAQADFDQARVLRVVYKIERSKVVIITFYPGRESQYEKE